MINSPSLNGCALSTSMFCMHLLVTEATSYVDGDAEGYGVVGDMLGTNEGGGLGPIGYDDGGDVANNNAWGGEEVDDDDGDDSSSAPDDDDVVGA